jgi:Flp pilus assembly protein TadG
MLRLRSLIRRGAAFTSRDEISGIAAVEFALLVPIMGFMFIAMADLGIGIYTDMQVSNAAQYGAEYALANGYDPDKVRSAVLSASGLSHLTVSPSQFCGCPNAGQVREVSCSAHCDDGNSAGTYAKVAVSNTYATIVPYPGLPSSFALTAQSTARVQ